MINFRADLHSHTYCSDGSLSPQALVELAVASNLQALSITDHDTVAAYAQALPLAEKLGLKLLSGIELSAYYESTTVHILGYGFDLNNIQLLDFCKRLTQARTEGNHIILEKLKRHRFNISEQELSEAFPNRVLGRPHIAQLMVRKGYISSVKAAFTQYLGDKGRCTRPPLKVLSIPDAVSLIHQAGGIAVLAHPHLFKNKKLAHKILDTSNNFDGIETYYGLMPIHLEQPIMDLAKQYNLIMTGGSDFHGDLTPHLKLGCSFTCEATFEPLYTLYKKNNPFSEVI